MQLSPEITTFLLIVAGALVGITGLGVTLTFGLYNLDRGVRASSTATAAPRPERPRAFTPTLSPVSRSMMAGGVVEAPSTLGMRHGKLGMWMFLASEVMFFTALIGAYIAFRVGGQIVVPHEDLNLALASLNTFLLISSSFTVVMALDSMIEGKQSRFIGFSLASMVLGIIFVTIQGIEWAELMGHGVTASSSLFGTAFFVTTGFHGMHVIVGLLWLIFVVLKGFRGDFTPTNYLGIENFGLYWHFVDIVWIVLFTIIYLI